MCPNTNKSIFHLVFCSFTLFSSCWGIIVESQHSWFFIRLYRKKAILGIAKKKQERARESVEKRLKKKRETVMLCIVNHSLWLFKSVSSPVLPKTVTQQITSFCSGQKNYYVVIAGVDAVVCAPKELILCNPFGFITYSIWGLTTLRPHPDCLCQRFSISEACLLWWAPKSHGEACTKLHACGEIICCLKSN